MAAEINMILQVRGQGGLITPSTQSTAAVLFIIIIYPQTRPTKQQQKEWGFHPRRPPNPAHAELPPHPHHPKKQKQILASRFQYFDAFIGILM